jgi:hypothetical protein
LPRLEGSPQSGHWFDPELTPLTTREPPLSTTFLT